MGGSSRVRPSRRSAGVAVVASAVLHASLVAVLGTGRAPQPLPPTPADDHTALELEIFTGPAAEAADDRPSAAVAQQGPQCLAREPARSPSRRSSGMRAIAPGAEPAPTPPPQPRGDEPSGSLLSMRPGGTRLPTPDYDTIDRLTGDGVIAPPDPRIISPHDAAGRHARRMRERAARETVISGKVDPLMHQLLRDARDRFTPSVAALDNDSRSPNTVGRTLKQWLGGARRGRPEDAADHARQRRPDQAGRMVAPDVLLPGARRSMELAGGTLGLALPGFSETQPRHCLVCVVIKPGAGPEIVLSNSSGNAEVDRAAVEALQRATQARPPGSDVRPQKSCYRFQASVERIPPSQAVGCTFDEVKLTAECHYPTKKVRKTTVHLESVEYDPAGG